MPALPDTVWLIRRAGGDGDAWFVETHPSQADQLEGNPHFEVLALTARPAGLPTEQLRSDPTVQVIATALAVAEGFEADYGSFFEGKAKKVADALAEHFQPAPAEREPREVVV